MESSQQPQPANRQAIAGAGVDSERKWYLLLSNPSKTTHLGTLLRCAAAFRVHQVLLVGYDKFNCQGSFGSHLFLDIVVFPSWDSVREYLRRGGDDGWDDNAINDANNDGNNKDQHEQKKSCTDEVPAAKRSSSANDPIDVIGILGAFGGGQEIYAADGMTMYENLDEEYVSLVPPKDAANTIHTHNNQEPRRSFPIASRPFSANACFLLSKDKRGLPLSQARMCNAFVHVPHLSLNDDGPPAQPSESNHLSASTSSNRSVPNPAIKPPITQSTLLDTATTLSIVLHHFTAWARYTERVFRENQKFAKDIKPDARRRLCRRVGEHYEKRKQNENSNEAEGNNEQDLMDATMFWNENGHASKDSDY